MIIRRIAALTSVALSLCACGQEAEPLSVAPSPADLAAMSRLVPADAVAVISTPSLNTLDDAMAQFTRLSGGNPAKLENLLRAAPGWPAQAQVNPNLPVILAVGSLAGTPTPAVVFILPVADGEALRAKAGGSTVHVDGSYVGVSLDPNYTPGNGPAPLAESPAAGDLTVRADLRNILTPLRPTAMAMLPLLAAAGAQANPSGPDFSQFMAEYVEGIFDAAESTESVELSFSMVGEKFEARGHLDVSPDSLLANIPPANFQALEDMLPWISNESSMQFALAANSEAYSELIPPLLRWTSSIYPNATEEALDEYVAVNRVLLARSGNVIVGHGNMGRGDFSFDYLYESPDPNGLVDILATMFEATIALQGNQQPNIEISQVDGWKQASTEIDFSELVPNLGEAAQLFGNDLVHYGVQASEGRVSMAMSSSGRVAQAVHEEQSGPSGDFRAALDRVEALDSRFAMSMDMGTFIAAGFEAAAAAMAADTSNDFSPSKASAAIDGLSAPLTVWAGGQGVLWDVGLTFEPGSIAAISEAMASQRR